MQKGRRGEQSPNVSSVIPSCSNDAESSRESAGAVNDQYQLPAHSPRSTDVMPGTVINSTPPGRSARRSSAIARAMSKTRCSVWVRMMQSNTPEGSVPRTDRSPVMVAPGMAGVEVKDVLPGNSASAEPLRIGIVADLQDPAADVLRMRAQEGFDIVTVDRRSAAETEVAAQRPQASRPPMPHCDAAGSTAQESAKAHSPRNRSRSRSAVQLPTAIRGRAKRSVRVPTNPGSAVTAQRKPAFLTARMLDAS